MTGLTQDLRFAYRTLVKSKAFTIVAVLALALGIGGTTVMYAAVDGVLLRPLPYPEPDRLVRLWAKFERGGTGSVSYEDFLDWKAQSRTLELLSALAFGDVTLAKDGDAERLGSVAVSGDFFPLLGVRPALGRTFSSDGYVRGDEVLLSHEVWQRRFAASPEVLGQPVRLSDRTYSVVGVLPAGFQMPTAAGGVYLPLVRQPGSSRGNHYLSVLGRVAPGATLDRAGAEMDGIGAALLRDYPDTNKGRGVLVRSWHESITAQLAPALYLLFGAVLLVLVIACANVANMLIARAAARQSELALRFALGASRGRVVRQLLTECAVLAVLGGLAGVLLAVWGVEACRAIVPPSFIFAIHLDGRALAFAALVAVGSVFAFGLAPALRAVKGDLAAAMKEGGRTVARTRSRLRSALVVLQVALSFALLVGAALLGRSFARVIDVEPGFEPRGLVTLQVALPPTQSPVPFYQRLLERVQALPEVASAGLVNFLPLSANNFNGGFQIEGKQTPYPNAWTEYQSASPGYFETMKMPIVRGRGITAADGADSMRVCVINQRMAKQYFGDDDPVGKRMQLGWSDGNDWFTVVGVVGDTKRRGLDTDAVPETYVPYTQFPQAKMALAVRGRGDLSGLGASLRREVAAVDPEQAAFDVTTMSAALDESVRPRRLLLDFTGVFGGVALALAAIGLYGVLAVQVAQRTHELGIRMALGARPRDVSALVVKNGMLLAAAGTAVGAVAAWLLSSVLVKLLFGVGATDLGTYIEVGATLLAVAWVAAWLPARRATRIDPMIALRAS